MNETLVDVLRRIVVDELDVKLGLAQIDARTPLFDGGLELDSFAIVELITLIEKRWSFEFSDTDLRPENFANLLSVALLVAERAAVAAPTQAAH